MPALRSLSVLGTLLLALGSCDTLTGPGEEKPGPPAQLLVVSGDGQDGTVGAELASPLVVKVVDAKGRPVPGHPVNFLVVSGRGSVFAGSTLSTKEGLAQERWTLGTVAADSQRVEARMISSETGATLSAVFRADARPAQPSALTSSGPTTLSGLAGAPLADSLEVRITDPFGNPVAGAPVRWAVRSGGGIVDPVEGTTNAQGLARALWMLGTRVDSAQVLEVASGTLPAVVFRATAGIPPTATLTRVSGDGQRAEVGTVLPAPLVLAVRLPDGRPVVGAQVTWSVVAGSGSVIPPVAITDSVGGVSASWLLGTAAGTNTVSAALGGGQSASFGAMAVAGAPHTIVAAGGSDQRGTVGGRLPTPLSLKVADRHGNPVPGVEVRWTVTSGGGAVTPASSLTAADGVASTEWTLGPTPGANAATATVSGLPPVAFTATGAVGAPARITVTGGDGQSAPVGTKLATSLAVRVTDAMGNPVSGVTVRWAATAGGGSLDPVSTRTGDAGVATAEWTLGGSAGTQTAAAAVDGLPAATFTATASAGAATRLQVVSGNGQSGAVGTVLGAPLVVAVTDAHGNPVSGVTVQWAATGGGGSLQPASSTSSADGRAQASWTLGSAPGPDTATAAVNGLSAVTFTATAVVGLPAALQKTGGDGQTGSPGAVLPDLLAVRVVDGYGNPVPGATVAWTVTSGGGSVSSASVVSDGEGVAKTRWTLGGSGIQTVQAAAGGAEPVSFTASLSSVGISIVEPAQGAITGDTLTVRAGVSSTYQVTSVTALVEGRQTRLSVPAGGTSWTGRIVLAGLAHGSKVLTVTATDAQGASATRQVSFVYDTPPSITVASPVPSSVARGTVRLAATCQDDNPTGCEWIEVMVVQDRDSTGPILASQAGSSIDETVSVSSYDPGKLTLSFRARDSAGQTRSRTVVLYVMSTPGWREVAAVHGPIWDVRSDRILFEDARGSVPSLKIRDRSTGGDATVVDDTRDLYGRFRYAHLTPQGAIFVKPLAPTNAQLYEWRNGSLASLGPIQSRASLVVEGDWAIWSSGVGGYNTLNRRDLSAGTTVQVARDAGNWMNDVAPNGGVAYWNSSYDIFRYRNGATTRLTSDDDKTTWNTYSVTDGTLTLYRKSTPCCGAQQYRIAMHDGSGETVLADLGPLEPSPGRHYAVNAGWAAFTRPGPGGELQVWTRSPAGDQKQVSFFGSGSLMQALGPAGEVVGPAGEVVFANGGRWYLATPPYGTSPRDIGPVWEPEDGRVFFEGGKLYLTLGRSLFEMDY